MRCSFGSFHGRAAESGRAWAACESEIQRATPRLHNIKLKSMSTSNDASHEAPAVDADVILNRLNVALARSQKLINSWLPPKPPQDLDAQDANSDSEDFKPMTEAGGIGSKAAYDDEGLPDGAFQRKKLSSNDKLLEQLLGKRAAHARKKSQAQESGKSMAASKHAAPKPLASRPKERRREVESEDEEEGGRAAAFKSRKMQRVEQQPVVKRVHDGVKADYVIDDDCAADDNTGLGLVKGEASTSAEHFERAERPTKRATGSYLDELLAQKAKKKRKKHNGGAS